MTSSRSIYVCSIVLIVFHAILASANDNSRPYETYRGAVVALDLHVSESSDKRTALLLTLRSLAAPLLVKTPVFHRGEHCKGRIVIRAANTDTKLRIRIPVDFDVEMPSIIRVPTGGYISQLIRMDSVNRALLTHPSSDSFLKRLDQSQVLELFVEVETSHFSNSSLYSKFREEYDVEAWREATREELRSRQYVASNVVRARLSQDGHVVLEADDRGNNEKESVGAAQADVKRVALKIRSRRASDVLKIDVGFGFRAITAKPGRMLFIHQDIKNLSSSPVSLFDPFASSSIRPNSTRIEQVLDDDKFKDVRDTPIRRVSGAHCADWYLLPPGGSAGRKWEQLWFSDPSETGFNVRVAANSLLLSECPWKTGGTDDQVRERRRRLERFATASIIANSPEMTIVKKHSSNKR